MRTIGLPETPDGHAAPITHVAYSPDGALLGTDGRYRDQAAEQIHAAGVEVDLEVGRPDAQQEAMAKRVADLKRLGLEASARADARPDASTSASRSTSAYAKRPSTARRVGATL